MSVADKLGMAFEQVLSECPLCRSHGRSSEMKLYEINFEESVILCSYSVCAYPLNSNDLKIVKTCDIPPNMYSKYSTVYNNIDRVSNLRVNDSSKIVQKQNGEHHILSEHDSENFVDIIMPDLPFAEKDENNKCSNETKHAIESSREHNRDEHVRSVELDTGATHKSVAHSQDIAVNDTKLIHDSTGVKLMRFMQAVKSTYRPNIKLNNTRVDQSSLSKPISTVRANNSCSRFPRFTFSSNKNVSKSNMCLGSNCSISEQDYTTEDINNLLKSLNTDDDNDSGLNFEFNEEFILSMLKENN